MTRLAATRLRDEMTETFNRVAYRGERIILERYGKDLVALVPLSDLKLLEAMEDRIDTEAAQAARADVEVNGTVAWSDLKAELGV